MTAIRAHSAIRTPSNDNKGRTVLLPGSPATYANRAVLREMGLRWDPAGHRWHGTTTAEAEKPLRERLGPEVQCFSALETEPPSGPSPPRSPAPIRAVAAAAMPPRDATQRPHDDSRTQAKARTVYRADEEDGVVHSRFSERDISSGLPDDSREEEERQEERRLRDIRGRVKAARAILSSTPGFADALARDWQKGAMFYARFGITEGMFVYGVPGRLRTPGGFPPELPEEIFPEALGLRFGLPPVTGYRLC